MDHGAPHAINAGALIKIALTRNSEFVLPGSVKGFAEIRGREERESQWILSEGIRGEIFSSSAEELA